MGNLVFRAVRASVRWLFTKSISDSRNNLQNKYAQPSSYHASSSTSHDPPSNDNYLTYRDDAPAKCVRPVKRAVEQPHDSYLETKDKSAAYREHKYPTVYRDITSVEQPDSCESKDKYAAYLDDKFPTYQEDTPVKCVRPVVHAVKQSPESFLEMTQLMAHPMPSRILEIERNGDTSPESMAWIKSWLLQRTHFRTSEQIYIEAYRMMIFFEEAVEAIEMEAFNLPAVLLHPIDSNEFYFNVSILDSEKLMAAIDENQLNRFTLRTTTHIPLQGKVTKRVANKIFVKLFYSQEWRCGVKYDIHFELNQLNYQIQHSALDLIEMHRLFPVLINNPLYHSQCYDASVTHMKRLLACDEHIARKSGSRSIVKTTAKPQRADLNPEQTQAIECIIGGSYNPLPYLLYGPPGTGKTKTIVAAIETIVRTTSKNILVCAQSNAACNEIAERLAKVLSNSEMLRMFSVNHDKTDIGPSIAPFSNLFDGKLNYPELNYLYKFRVLICTLSVSGCLSRAYDLNPKHFGYVFIDESTSACETMSLIPIAGLCTTVNNVHANIVLIGDPKQLDAVIRSDWAIKLGFKTSWFERLFNAELYKRHTETGQFNATYITQLTRNYRSHQAILQIPNEIFYENTLKAVVVPNFINLNVPGLQSKNFPIIFQSVYGYCKKPEDDTSSFNSAEVTYVMEYIENLMQPEKYNIAQCDIGVVSPYRLQCNIIRKRCQRHGYKHITIGSAEQFQGQERKVMIISTVRSGGSRLGDFVKNPQRFNVMITRAKSLLIVVGNPQLLSQDENWSKFIDYCIHNGCLLEDGNHHY